MTEARHWTINGDFTALAPSGVPRYALEVTRALDRLVGEDHPSTRGLKLRLVAPHEPIDLGCRNIAIEVVPEFRTPRLPQFWVQAQLPRRVEGGLLSFCNLAPVWPRKHIVCIHDLHTHLMPDAYGRGFRLAHRVVLPLLGRRAYAVTTVSRLSAQHIVAAGVAPASKIIVAHNGCDHARSWHAADSQLPLGVRPYALFFGHGQAYKNAALVERIAPALQRTGLDVLIAGGPVGDALSDASSQTPSNVRRLGRVSDDDLALLLSRALCLLMPSRIEGFGLPAVEAMVHGCPVVASTAPALPEVCGDAALYADPDDDGAWIDAVSRLLTDQKLRSDFVQRGRSRAELFTWRKVALTYLALMASADAGRPPQQSEDVELDAGEAA